MKTVIEVELGTRYCAEDIEEKIDRKLIAVAEQMFETVAPYLGAGRYDLLFRYDCISYGVILKPYIHDPLVYFGPTSTC